MELTSFIRDIADYPSPGVTFKDITPLLADPGALSAAVEQMVSPFRDGSVSVVAGIEARGFLFGPPMAMALDVGFIPLRKPGKLPADVIGVDYALEYGTDRLEMHREPNLSGETVLIVDDVLATGGTLAASRELLLSAGADVAGASVLIELLFLSGAKRLEDLEIHSVIEVA